MFKVSRDSASIVVVLVFCALPVVINAAATPEEAEFDQIPLTLHAKDVLPKGMLKGKHHIVEDEVISNGIYN